MKVLGLSFDFHDSSVALVENGKLLFAAAEERFTRQKHDSYFPQFSIQSALEVTKTNLEDLDAVVFYESPENKFSRLINTCLENWPMGAKEFLSIISTWLSNKLWTKARIAHRLQISPHKIATIPHHMSHAYQAFVGSGLDVAAILVLDAVGEWDSGSTYFAEWKNGKPVLNKLSEMKFPHSVGLFYSAMTDFLGFKPMNDECTLMALAAFGQPIYYEQLRELIQLNEDGSFQLPNLYFNFQRFYKKPYTHKLINLLGEPRPHYLKLNFSSFQKTMVTRDEERWVNIAASVQKVTEEIIVRQAKALLSKTHSTNLCFAGGVALNCVANTKLLLEAGCKNLFIPVEPGDGGAAIGAAFAGYFQNQNTPAHNSTDSIYNVSLGPTSLSQDILNMLPHLHPNQLQKYRQTRSDYIENLEWEWQETSSISELAKLTAKEILNDKIVGWFQGGMELGPRALGQRSILIRPDNIQLAQKLSDKVKVRAAFRPYALSMTPNAAKKIFDQYSENILQQKPMEWMQLALTVDAQFHEALKAGIHIDGTTRPQVITDIDHPYYQLLSEIGQHSRLECVLNTSFNEKDYPIVATATEALMMFARTNMDVLVIGNLIIKKRTT